MVFVFVAKGDEKMAKKRANGEGSIRKRSDGRWEGRYTAGRNLTSGKPIYKNVLGKTQTEVKEKLKIALAECEKIDVYKSAQYTVGEWMDVWFENYAAIKVRPSSHQTYKGYIEHHIKPHIGCIPLNKLTTLDLQKLYKKLMKAGRVERIESKKQPKGLSAKTVRNLNQIISSATDMAIEQKLISVNPTNKCALPKVEHHEMNTLTQDQLAAFLAEARRSGVYEMYYTELATGLRRGELLGLKWGDIDFKDNAIRVHRQVARIDGNVVEAPLKTKNAYRCVAITQDVAAMLKQKKVDDNGRSEYVFSSETGGPISPDSVLNMLHRVLDRAGLPRLRFHDLRHPYVKHTTKIFSLRLMDFQAQAYPDARRKTRGACQLLRVGQSRSPVRPLCNRKRFSCLPPQSKMSWILYAISMRLSGYTSTRSISSSASSVVSVSASKIALDASLRLSCRACSSCFFFACANTAA